MLIFLLHLATALGTKVEERISCSPEGHITTTECHARGCIFEPLEDPELPWCFFPEDAGYEVESVEEQENVLAVKLKRSSKYR